MPKRLINIHQNVLRNNNNNNNSASKIIMWHSANWIGHFAKRLLLHPMQIFDKRTFC